MCNLRTLVFVIPAMLSMFFVHPSWTWAAATCTREQCKELETQKRWSLAVTCRKCVLQKTNQTVDIFNLAFTLEALAKQEQRSATGCEHGLEAAQHLREYLKQVSLEPPQRKTLEEHIAKLERENRRATLEIKIDVQAAQLQLVFGRVRHIFPRVPDHKLNAANTQSSVEPQHTRIIWKAANRTSHRTILCAGVYTLFATAPDYDPQTSTVTLTTDKITTLQIQMQPSKKIVSTPSSPKLASTSLPQSVSSKKIVSPPPTSPKASHSQVNSLWIAFYVSIGVAVASLGTGITTNIIAKGQAQETYNIAYQNHEWKNHYDSTNTLINVANVSYVTSGVLGATAVGLLIAALLQTPTHTNPKTKTPTPNYSPLNAQIWHSANQP